MPKNKPKILIVDDQESVRITVGMHFEEAGYNVLMAGSAKEALSLIKKENPQIILSDRNMPDTNGIELLKEIRKFNSQVKVVIMSGDKLDPVTKTEIEKLNVLDYIDKPVDFEHLQKTLRNGR